MRIATWNVAYGLAGATNQRRLGQIRAIEADVWVLTETHDSLSLTEDGFEPVHAAQRPIGDGANKNVIDHSRWVTIWSRHPVRYRCDDLVDANRTVACVVDTGSTDLLVYGTVLPWLTDTETEGMGSVLSTQGPEWTSLHAMHSTMCVAGDFNVNLGGPHLYGSNESKAAVAAALREAELTPVTDFDHTPGRAFGLIDHIAVSDSLAIEEAPAQVWPGRTESGEYLSDHPGVAVDIRV